MKKKKSFGLGQTLVEWAIILPVLLIFIMLILDFGRAAYYYSAIYNAAREGARYASIHPHDDLAIDNQVRKYSIGLDPTTLVISHSISGDNITVTIQYTFYVITPIITPITGTDNLVLTTSSTMQIENP